MVLFLAAWVARNLLESLGRLLPLPHSKPFLYYFTREIFANRISGTISPSLGSLQALKKLYVIDMEAVRWWIGRVVCFKHHTLNHCVYCFTRDISANSLSGTICPSLGRLTMLIHAYVHQLGKVEGTVR